MKTHKNDNGESYFSTVNDNGETIFSFTTDFEDIWSQEDQDLHEEREHKAKMHALEAAQAAFEALQATGKEATND